MSDEQTNAVRDQLIVTGPGFESTVRTRDEVVNKWCADHGINKDDLTMEQVLEIRALPEWKNAS